MLPGQRIAVIGTSGSGKTTVAKAVAGRLGLTYVSNDAIIWRADWVQTPADEVFAELERRTRAPRWSFDGNLGDDAHDRLVLARADTLVWLDLPRAVVHWQVIRRTLRRLVTREPLWHGNRESLATLFSRDSIVLWSVTTYARRKRQYRALFADPGHDRLIRIRLRTTREVNAWVRSCARETDRR